MILRCIGLLVGAAVLFLVVVPFALWLQGVDVYDSSPFPDRKEEEIKERAMWRSHDGARSWELVSWRAPFAVEDITALALHPKESKILYAGTRSRGIWKSVDAGSTWIRAGAQNAALVKSAILRIVIAPSNPKIVYAAYYDGRKGRLAASKDAGAHFRDIYEPSHAPFAVLDIWAHPTDENYLLIATAEGGVLSSHNGGAMWRAHAWFGEPVAAISANPSAPHEMHLMTQAGDVHTSADGGVSWDHLASDAYVRKRNDQIGFDASSAASVALRVLEDIFLPARRMALVRDPLIPSRFYLIAPEGLYRSEDGARSWASVKIPVSPGAQVDAVAIHPFNSSVIFAASGDMMYASADAGVSWRGDVVEFGKVSFMAISRADPNVMMVISGR